MRTPRTLPLALVAAVLLAAPAGALAAVRTTLPTKTIVVEVFITDQRVLVIPYQGQSISSVGFLPLVGPIPRGDYLNFSVLNRGKKPHDFTIFGRKTAPIKPGGRAEFHKLALARGTFPWTSPLNKGKQGFTGTVRVA
jgi:hypothetical protein